MKIKIAAYDYEVKPLSDKDRHGIPCIGLCKDDTHEIHIWEDLPAREWSATLLHEIMHAIWYRYAQQREAESEEHIVRVMEEGLMQVFRDNLKLKEILFDPEKYRGRTNTKSSEE